LNIVRDTANNFTILQFTENNDSAANVAVSLMRNRVICAFSW